MPPGLNVIEWNVIEIMYLFLFFIDEVLAGGVGPRLSIGAGADIHVCEGGYRNGHGDLRWPAVIDVVSHLLYRNSFGGSGGD